MERERLRYGDVRSIIGTTVNAAGLTLAKSVPAGRADAFADVGMGASPVWHVFCIDAAIAFTESITAVGDMRLRIDRGELRDLGDGLAWAPASYVSQDGDPEPGCTRTALVKVEARLASNGISARIGHELEFVLVGPDGADLRDPAWTPYGAGSLLGREEFVGDLIDATNAAGVPLEQVHAEYGRNQFEISLPHAEPVAAADAAVLARLLVGREARSHGMLASFSPLPFHDGVGNGAHQHISLSRDGAALFEGGPGPYGIHDAGGAAVGGILNSLQEIQGLLSGSVLSGARLKPGMWSGVHSCWGLENREAAVRFVAGGPHSAHGPNIEVKIIDPSANPYCASAALLSAALHGIRTGAVLPAEVPDDPSKLAASQLEPRGIALLPDDGVTIVDNLDQSHLARTWLGEAVVDATVATRRYEHSTYGDRETAELAERFRLAWSV